MPCRHVAIDAKLGQERVRHPPSHAQLQPPFETHFHAGEEWTTTRPIRARKREINHIERLLSRWPMPSCARAHRRAPGVRSYECSVQRGRDRLGGGNAFQVLQREIKSKLIGCSPPNAHCHNRHCRRLRLPLPFRA